MGTRLKENFQGFKVEIAVTVVAFLYDLGQMSRRR